MRKIKTIAGLVFKDYHIVNLGVVKKIKIKRNLDTIFITKNGKLKLRPTDTIYIYERTQNNGTTKHI